MEIKRQDCVVKKLSRPKNIFLPRINIKWSLPCHGKAGEMSKYIRSLIQNSTRKYSVSCLSCVTYCPVFETKARINALIPFDAISRSKSIDLQQ